MPQPPQGPLPPAPPAEVAEASPFEATQAKLWDIVQKTCPQRSDGTWRWSDSASSMKQAFLELVEYYEGYDDVPGYVSNIRIYVDTHKMALPVRTPLQSLQAFAFT